MMLTLTRIGWCVGLLSIAKMVSAAPAAEPVAFSMEIASKREATADELTTVLKYLNSKNQPTVGAAALALGQLGNTSPVVLQALESKLGSANPEATRSVAAFALMSLGEPGRAILLRRAESAVSVDDRLAAITALRADLAGLKDPHLRELMQDLFRKIESIYNPNPVAAAASDAIQDVTLEKGPELADWSFQTANGGTGKAGFDSTQSRGAGGSIRLEKTSASGEIFLRSTRTFVVKAGTQPMVRLYFRSDDAPFNSTLQLYFERKNGSLTTGEIARGWVVMGNTLPRNLAPGEWSKRFMQAPKSGQDQEYRIVVMMRGNPAVVWLDDINAPAPAYGHRQTVPTETLLEARWKDEPTEPAKAELRSEGDRVRLLVNGKPVPPVFYNVLRSQFGDNAGMEQLADVKLQLSSVQISDIVDDRYPPVVPVWTEARKLDFTTPLRWLEGAMTKAQDSHFILNLHLCWPRGWTHENPEDAWCDEAGAKGYGTGVHFKGFVNELPSGADQNLPDTAASAFRWWPSPFSERALLDAEHAIEEFVAAVKTKPYANRVVGAFITGGHDFQFMTAMWPDYSEPARKAFKVWLTKRYQTDEALRSAWNDPAVTLATAEIPKGDSFLKTVRESNNLFLDPQTSVRFVDHQKFQAEQGLIIRERLAGAFKKAWGRPVFAMTWQMGGGRGQGVEDVMLPSEGLDILVPQPFYELRLPGNVGGVRAALSSMSARGKLAVKELDMRTWLRTSGAEIQAHRLGSAMNPDEFRQIYRREAAQMIAAGHGYWFLDLATTHYRDPQLLEEIASGVRAYRELEIDNPTPVRPDVAMVWTDDSAYWMADFFKDTSMELGGASTSILQILDRYTPAYLKQSGVPYEDVYLADILSGAVRDDYKVLVFGDAFRLTDAQREGIRAKLQSKGRTLVWNYAAGYVGEHGRSDKAVSELTGITIQSESVSKLPAVLFNPGSDPLVSGLSGTPGIGEMGFVLMSGGIPKPNLPTGFPRFVVADPKAVSLASYADGKTAIAVKRFPEWTSVYFGMLGTLDAAVFSRMAKQAGAFVLADDPAVAVEFNGRFLSLHGLRNGPVSLSLPHVSNVFDFDTGELVTTGQKISLPLEAGQTRWFKVEPVKP